MGGNDQKKSYTEEEVRKINQHKLTKIQAKSKMNKIFIQNEYPDAH